MEILWIAVIYLVVGWLLNALWLEPFEWFEWILMIIFWPLILAIIFCFEILFYIVAGCILTVFFFWKLKHPKEDLDKFLNPT